MKTFWDICIDSVTLHDGWLRASVVTQRNVPSANRGPGGPRGDGINNW